jgi:DNA-binding CsgD family transcriptional regulator
MAHSDKLQALAIDSLFEAGLLGIAWVDESLTILSSRGALADILPFGQKLCNSFPVLFGMEQDLYAMATSHQAEMAIPGAMIVKCPGASEKMTIRIIWDRKFKGYTLLILPDAKLHQEESMIQTLRTRRIAENIFNSVADKSANLLHPSPYWTYRWDSSDSMEIDTIRNPLLRLTQREKEVVRLVIKGHSNKLIAHELNISMKTVEAHRARAVKRLGVKTSAELIRLAGQFGI